MISSVSAGVTACQYKKQAAPKPTRDCQKYFQPGLSPLGFCSNPANQPKTGRHQQHYPNIGAA